MTMSGIFRNRFRVRTLWELGLVLIYLTSTTYVSCELIPDRSLVISTQNRYFEVFPGLENWVQNGIVNTSFTYMGWSWTTFYKPRGLAFLLRESRDIFIFSDYFLRRINVINVTSPLQQAIAFHIGTSEGVGQIAVDWVSGNCYWVDTLYGWIVMQSIPKDLRTINSLNTKFKMVVDTLLYIPTGIAVYPKFGYLFWTDTGKIPKIERSSLTGKNRRILVWQGVICPTSLCIDYSTNRLYWTDPCRGTVEYSDLHGNRRNILLHMPGSSFNGIDIFQDMVVVSDWVDGHEWGNHTFTLFSTADGKMRGGNNILSVMGAFPMVVYDRQRQPLDSSPRCDTMNCEHVCIERPNSTGADCTCEDGYSLNSNGISCDAETQVLTRKIVYTNANKICCVSIKGLTAYMEREVDCAIVNSTNNITRFTIDTHKQTFYFTDGQKIYHQTQFSAAGSEEVYSTNRAIIDLAYDWIKGVLYWFEWEGRFGYCFKKADPSSPREEFTKTRTRPISMTFDPYSQLLFWIADGPFRITIADGRTVRIIYSYSMRNPTDLEYDWFTDRLVWTDDGFMGLMNSDGTNEKIIDLVSTCKYHSLTVFQNYTIIGYSEKTNAVNGFTVVPYQGYTRFYNFKLPDMKRVDDVKVYALQLKIEPCDRNNGGCEHICIPDSSTTCSCYAGYKLSVDGKTCTADVRPEDFILAIDAIDHNVYQISTDGKPIHALKIGKGTIPSSIDFDPINQRIVLIDPSDKRIQYSQLSGQGVRVAEKDDITPYSHVAVDVSTGNFYVTLNNTIVVIDPGFDVKTLINTIQNPGKIIVFPRLGEMAWIEGSKIRKAKMDGTDSKDFTPEGINTPIDIAFDYDGDTLYWCDGKKIGRTELLTNTSEVIFSDTAEQPNKIYIAGEYLYYTSFINIRAIYRRNKTRGAMLRTVFEPPLLGLASLFVYQNPRNACQLA